MTDQPLISVITPSFNQGAFLARCVQSVLDQRYPHFEHIVYDNCSTDGTTQILRRFPHLLWTQEPDRGQSHALNKGFRRARGEIIAWLNADDAYEPGAFAVAARELHAQTGTRAIAGRVHIVDEQGRIGRTQTPTVDSLDRMVAFWTPGFSLDQCGVFFRREVLEEIGGLDESLHYAMDYEFFLRLLARHRLKLVPEVLARFTLHPASKTGRADRSTHFFAERRRASARYWGRRGTASYRRNDRFCSRHLATVLMQVVLRAYRQEGRVDWPALGQAAALRPGCLLNRHVLGLLAERALGTRLSAALRHVATRRPPAS